jgi:hypothetical protein
MQNDLKHLEGNVTFSFLNFGKETTVVMKIFAVHVWIFNFSAEVQLPTETG